jgi:hypothetical protein
LDRHLPISAHFVPRAPQVDALQKANATLNASAAALDRELSEKTADGVRLRDAVHVLETSAQDAKAAADALQVWKDNHPPTRPLPQAWFFMLGRRMVAFNFFV